MSVSYGDSDIFTLLGTWLRYWRFHRQSMRRLRELHPGFSSLEAEYSERLERILRHALDDEAAALVPADATLTSADVIQFRRARRSRR